VFLVSFLIPELPCPMIDDPEFIPREREISLCPCKSRKAYEDCCLLFHYGRAQPKTAEALMRARYSAYFFRRVDYLVETTHPDTRAPTLRADLEGGIYRPNWSNLTIVNTSRGGEKDRKGMVEFVATYYVDDEPNELHERSKFKKYKGRWKYLDLDES